MRALADVAPPHGVSELASRTGLSKGYVSPLLRELEREELIQRGRRGRVEQVDLDRVVLRLAATYDPEAFNRASRYVAGGGLADAVTGLQQGEAPVVLTGALAAGHLVSTAPGGLLVGYSAAPEVVASAGALEPVGPGDEADVVLLEPFDDVLVASTWSVDGLTFAAPVQIAVDCLTLDDPGASAAVPAVLGWLRQPGQVSLMSTDWPSTSTVGWSSSR